MPFNRRKLSLSKEEAAERLRRLRKQLEEPDEPELKKTFDEDNAVGPFQHGAGGGRRVIRKPGGIT